MHFDDRLGTVLRHRAQGNAVARIQYRQLLDLLGTLPSEARDPQIDAAYARLGELSQLIPAAARAQILAQPGLRLRSPRLVAQLAEAEPQAAAAAIRRAELDTEQWLDLVPALAPHARNVVRARDDLPPAVEKRLIRLGIFDRALPPAEGVAVDVPEDLPAGVTMAEEASVEDVPAEAPMVEATLTEAPAAEMQPLPATEGIGALVRRIEDFRKARKDAETDQARGDSPRLPLGEELLSHRPSPRAFDFWTDTDGRIVSADPAVAPMVVGIALTAQEGGQGEPGRLHLTFRRRQPIRATTVELVGAPAIAGIWQVDAQPVFAQLGGRFAGYAGRMRRPAANEAPAVAPANGEADRIRQLLHELRTPVNAIQGFAEVIQQQLFGPTPHEYRALAANIAGDAARMLAGFEELERLARLDSGVLEIEPGTCEIATIFAATASRLDPFTSARGSRFALKLDDGPLTVGIAQAEGERLAWRLLATLAGASAPGEILKLRARRRGGEARLSVDLPASLAEREDDEVFHASAVPGIRPATPVQSLSAGMFGAGFSLRLARAEAIAASGSLERRGERLRLSLPLSSAPVLTGQAGGHSQDSGSGTL
jgi:signal transduction histidine kinase